MLQGVHTSVDTSNMNDHDHVEDFQPSITFLNMSGDITITWDEHNRAKMTELIKKKMSEGYSFFTTAKVPLIPVTRRKKVTEKNLSNVDTIIISDEVFEQMITQMNDKDIAEAVRDGSASVNRRKDKGTVPTIKREGDPDKVSRSNSVAVRPIYGG